MNHCGGENRRELRVEGMVPFTFDYESTNALYELGFCVERS